MAISRDDPVPLWPRHTATFINPLIVAYGAGIPLQKTGNILLRIHTILTSGLFTAPVYELQ